MKKFEIPLFAAGSLALLSLPTLGAEIRVPEDYPTIQEGIDAAADADVVRVAPGVYQENITFRGKGISVESTDGPEVTSIVGDGTDSVVRFETREPLTAVLSGFTITGGGGGGPSGCSGGGVVVWGGASATIRNNFIVENRGCEGGGIAVFGRPVIIESNFISNNEAMAARIDGTGAGIYLLASDAEIFGNVIAGNRADAVGGVDISGGAAVVRDNLISDNSSRREGGGISVADSSAVSVIENVIVRNTANQFAGGVLLYSVPSIFVNNTIADNDITFADFGGSAMGVFDLRNFTEAVMANNTFVSNSQAPTVWLFQQPSSPPTFFTNNNSWNSVGSRYGGYWPDQTGEYGNISADPLFVDPSGGDYHLQSGSPCIDVGRNDVPGLSSYDFDGNPRIVDGSGIGRAIIDLGAYEFQPSKDQ